MATQTETKSQTKPREDTDPPKQWNVILIDDDHHTYEYVIRMMQTLFHHSVERGYLVAKKVDSDGRAVCMTTHKELAELKREQIHAFGADPMMATSRGSMTAVIEPAEFEGDDESNSDDTAGL